MTHEPDWLAEARKYIGLREIPGAPTEPTIRRWLTGLRAWWSDDSTPWCGVFVASMMQATGRTLPKHWYRAKGWLDWGVAIDDADVGCVVVFERQGGGHVGFVVGRDLRGNLLVLGGNQGDAVSIAAFPRARVLGFRWPVGMKIESSVLPFAQAEMTGGEA